MIKSLFSITGLVGSALLLSACSTSSPNVDTNTPTAPPTPLVVTDQDTCRNVMLQPLQPLVVRFESNPSTGYQWSLLQESSILQLERSQFVAPRSDGDEPPVVGAPGVHEWQFSPRQKGNDTLVFTYQQPWDRTSYRKIECHVTVE